MKAEMSVLLRFMGDMCIERAYMHEEGSELQNSIFLLEFGTMNTYV